MTFETSLTSTLTPRPAAFSLKACWSATTCPRYFRAISVRRAPKAALSAPVAVRASASSFWAAAANVATWFVKSARSDAAGATSVASFSSARSSPGSSKLTPRPLAFSAYAVRRAASSPR